MASACGGVPELITSGRNGYLVPPGNVGALRDVINRALLALVTRDTISGGVLGADQRVTRSEALRMATLGNAWLMMEDHEKGTIEPGVWVVWASVNPIAEPERNRRHRPSAERYWTHVRVVSTRESMISRLRPGVHRPPAMEAPARLMTASTSSSPGPAMVCRRTSIRRSSGLIGSRRVSRTSL